MGKYPEYVKCVRYGDVNGVQQTWCGRQTTMEFHFTNTEHAALNGKQNGRHVACPDCVDEIVKALKSGHDKLGGE